MLLDTEVIPFFSVLCSVWIDFVSVFPEGVPSRWESNRHQYCHLYHPHEPHVTLSCLARFSRKGLLTRTWGPSLKYAPREDGLFPCFSPHTNETFESKDYPGEQLLEIEQFAVMFWTNPLDIISRSRWKAPKNKKLIPRFQIYILIFL